MIKHTEPLVLPSATDHGAGGAWVRHAEREQGFAAQRQQQPGTAACPACMCAQACEAAAASALRARQDAAIVQASRQAFAE